MAVAFRRAPGQSLKYSRELGSFIATKMIDGRPAPLAVRSYRELRRWHLLGRADGKDLVMTCLRAGAPIKVFYDVGASNGIYGFAAHALHGCDVVLVEPYTPSIETILKTVYAHVRAGASREAFEVVPAAVDSEEGMSRLEMHGPPVAGETRNTFADASLYTGEDRAAFPVSICQWTKGVSLDALIFKYGLPKPTVLKIDVDGYEALAIRGARELLSSGSVELIIVEINNEQAQIEIEQAMRDNGYRLVCSKRHHEDDPDEYVSDWVFAHASAFERWSMIADRV